MTGKTSSESTMVEPAVKRRFTDVKKRKIIAEYEAATTETERGIIVRRWGTYQHTVKSWIEEFSMTKPTKTKSRSAPTDTQLAKRLAVSEAKLLAATERVELLEELVEAQGKVVGLHAKSVGSPPRG